MVKPQDEDRNHLDMRSWCWCIGPQKRWKLRRRSRRPPKHTSGILRDPVRECEKCFLDFLGWIDLHFSQSPAVKWNVCAKFCEIVRHAKVSNIMCGSVLYISLHHLNPSAMLDPNAFAFHLAPLCPGPIVGGSWCQEQGPGKPWRFLVISCDFRCDPYDPSMKCARASTARDHWKISRRLILHLAPFNPFGSIWPQSLMFGRPPLHTCVFATVLKHRRQGDVWYCDVLRWCLGVWRDHDPVCDWLILTPCFNFCGLVAVECLAAGKWAGVEETWGVGFIVSACFSN